MVTRTELNRWESRISQLTATLTDNRPRYRVHFHWDGVSDDEFLAEVAASDPSALYGPWVVLETEDNRERRRIFHQALVRARAAHKARMS